MALADTFFFLPAACRQVSFRFQFSHASMFLEPPVIVGFVLLGLLMGFLAGLLGLGGGMVMVPFITIMLDHQGVPAALAVKMAIATSMATIMLTSLSSLRRHHRRGAVRWEIVRGLAPGLVLGGLLAGAAAFAVLKGAALALGFAVFIGYSATQMLRNRQPRPGRQMPGRLVTAGVGGAIGFVSGLVGAGGAFM